MLVAFIFQYQKWWVGQSWIRAEIMLDHTETFKFIQERFDSRVIIILVLSILNIIQKDYYWCLFHFSMKKQSIVQASNGSRLLNVTDYLYVAISYICIYLLIYMYLIYSDDCIWFSSFKKEWSLQSSCLIRSWAAPVGRVFIKVGYGFQLYFPSSILCCFFHVYYTAGNLSKFEKNLQISI